MKGCKNCPAYEKCSVTYRGSACEALRGSYGLTDDPEILTNADKIRGMDDEGLAKVLTMAGEFENEVCCYCEYYKRLQADDGYCSYQYGRCNLEARLQAYKDWLRQPDARTEIAEHKIGEKKNKGGQINVERYTYWCDDWKGGGEWRVNTIDGHEQSGPHIDFLAAIENILGEEYSIDRLRELVEADRDGRCVLLPRDIIDVSDGEEALRRTMRTLSVSNNGPNRYIADAVAEKLVREASADRRADAHEYPVTKIQGGLT